MRLSLLVSPCFVVPFALVLACPALAAAQTATETDPPPAQPLAQPAPGPVTYGVQPTTPPAAAPPPADRPFTTPLPAGSLEPRTYGYTEAEGSGGRGATYRTAWNAIFAEGMGSAGLYSINYDRIITEIISVRLGFSYMRGQMFDKNVGAYTIPLMVNFLFGTYQHKLDIGVGGVFNIVESGKQSLPPFDGGPVGGSFNIGYRYTPPDGGLMVRVGFSPIFGAGGFWPWGGVSIGYQF